jgi:glycosyltransferase involved in cell wall biosynthesis
MLLEVIRANARALRIRVGFCWLGVPLVLLSKMRPIVGSTSRRLRQLSRNGATATYVARWRLARAILHLSPHFTPIAVKIKGNSPLAVRSVFRICRQMLRQPLPTDAEVYRPIPRRIILVGASLAPGGAERQIVYTMGGLASKPVESVQLLCGHLSPGPPHRYDFYLPAVRAAGLSVRQIKARVSPNERRRLPARLAAVAAALPSGLVADIANLYWEFLDLRPEVVHAWLDWCNVRAGIAAVLAGVPRILVSGRNINPSHFAFYDDYMDPAYRALARCPNVTFINNSMAGAHDYADWIGIPRERIQVIRNGVDFGSRGRLCTSEVATLRRSFGIPEGAFVVGGMFRFAAEKRPLLWIEAAGLIAKQIDDVHFIIFGEGHMEPEMKARAKELGLIGRLTMPGVTKDAFSADSMMDVFMLTSFAEGIPNVVLEAQWVGTPVVATNAGGTAETVEQGVTGWILDDPSGQLLAQQVYELYASPALRHTARIRGPEFVRHQFGVTRMIEKTWAAYGYG